MGPHSPGKGAAASALKTLIALETDSPYVGNTTWQASGQLLGAAIVDGGHPFGVSSTITADRTTRPDAASELTGYVIIEAPDLDVANHLARQCPALDTDIGRVEVYTALTY